MGQPASGHNDGDVVQITNGRDSARTAAYTYDQVNRLATAQTPNAGTWGNSYVYDAWGNLLQKNVLKGMAENMSLTVNTNNQFPAFTYDAAGNVTSDTTNAMKYDAEGRMNPLSGVTNTYDGDGRRVQKSDGTLYWVDDNFQPLSVGTTSGVTRDYIFVGGQRIAFVPISTGNAYYYLSDHLGSDTVVASGDGKSIQWEGEFFPFGAQRTVITNLASNPFQFTGYEYDSGTGYNYAVARYDAGRWGRFLSPDPYMGSIDVTNPQSLNLYVYTENNPTNFVDPLGLFVLLTPPPAPPTAPDPINLCDLPGFCSPKIMFIFGGPSGGGTSVAPQNEVPQNPCNYAGRNLDPSAWAAMGKGTKNNPFTTAHDLKHGFAIGGYLDAQPMATGSTYEKAAYGNYVFGAYMSAAGFPLSVALAGANGNAFLQSLSNSSQYSGRKMDNFFRSLPAANVANITAGYNAQRNGTLCHK